MSGTDKTLAEWVGGDEQRVFQAICQDCGRNLGRHVAWRGDDGILGVDDYLSATGGFRSPADFHFPGSRTPRSNRGTRPGTKSRNGQLKGGQRTKGLVWGAPSYVLDARLEGYLYRYCPCNLRVNRDVKRRGDKLGLLTVDIPEAEDERLPRVLF